VPRAVVIALLVVGAVPWVLLLVLQALNLFLLVVVNSDLGTCFDEGALPTAAMIWLALAPLPLGIATVLRWRTVGLPLLGIGFPLLVLSVGKVGCPASVLPFDDADAGSVPVSGWALAAYLGVLVCFGLVLLADRRPA
jgi:hypothetical protein